MSKQSSIILILLVFFGAIGTLLWFYFSFNPINTNPIVPVSTIDTDTNTYNPFGTQNTSNQISTSSNNISLSTSTTQNNQLPVNKLRQITNELTAGFSISDNVNNIVIRYILRSNGNIYETKSDSLEKKRLSITTIPKVYEANWLPDNNKLIARYLKEGTENIQSFSVKINQATTSLNETIGSIDGTYLPENIHNLAISPKGDRIFYLISNLTGSTGYISKTDGTNKKIIFESPLVEWLVSWPKEEIITLNTKPSSGISGFMYFLNSQTGSLSRIIGDINGLTTKTNSSGTEVLYSDSTRTTPRLYLLDIKKGESKLLPWNTLPEKCVWGNTDAKTIYCAVPKYFSTGIYPDLWYQGLTNFNDSLSSLNTETGAVTLINDFSSLNNNIDIINPQINKDDGMIFFMNKTNLSLWSLNLK